MIKKAKISASQLCIMLVVSRLYSIFTYKPQSYDLGVVSSAICILISAVITFLIFAPALLVIQKRSDTSVSDLAYMRYGKLARVYSATLFAVCIFLAVETLTQFEFFMSSTLYLTSMPIFFLLPILAAAVFICHKGVETIARLSGFVFLGLIASLVLISLLALGNFESVWLGNMANDSIKEMGRLIADNVFHGSEAVIFLVLCENVKTNAKKSAFWFVIVSTILLELVSAVTILSLGDYRKTILFPFYTVSAMSENSLTDRFGLVFITLWIFMAAIRLSLYLFVAAKSLEQLFTINKKGVSVIVSAVIILAVSLFTTDRIVSVEIMYRIILTGIPLILVAVLFPILVLLKQKRR